MGVTAGLQITPKLARLLVLENKKNILDYKEAKLTEINNLTSGIRLPGKVAASIDSNVSIFRELTLPFTSDEQIAKTFKFQFESLLHGYDIDKYVVDYIKTSQNETETHLICMGIPKTEISNCLKLAGSIKVDPTTIDLDIFALFLALQNLGKIESNRKYLIVFFDKDQTELILTHSENIQAVRCIASNEAKLVGEIERFLAAFSVDSPDEILLIGAKEKQAELEKQIGIPVKLIDGTHFPEEGLVAYGLALIAADVPQGFKLDLRQGEFSYKKKYEKIKSTLALCVELLIVFFAVLSLHLYFNKIRPGREELSGPKGIIQAQRIMFSDISTEKVRDDEIYKRFSNLYNEQKELSGDANLPIKSSAIEHCEELFACLSEFFKENQSDNSFYLEIEGIIVSMDEKSITMRGKVPQTYLQALKDKIDTKVMFKGVELINPTKDPNTGFVSFTLKHQEK